MMPHEKPDEKDIEENKQFEPEGEALRAKIIAFLEENKIVSVLMDTATHSIEIQSAELPGRIRGVLTSWGSIYVLDEGPEEVLCNWVPPARPKDWDDNIIPPMTHPMSKGRTQPDTSMVKIDEHTAAMPMSVFKRLMEYSASMPSGVYEGKMWKALAYSSHGQPDGSKPEHWPRQWHLRWYGYSKIGAGHVSNNQRRIVLTDGELP